MHHTYTCYMCHAFLSRPRQTPHLIPPPSVSIHYRDFARPHMQLHPFEMQCAMVQCPNPANKTPSHGDRVSMQAMRPHAVVLEMLRQYLGFEMFTMRYRPLIGHALSPQSAAGGGIALIGLLADNSETTFLITTITHTPVGTELSTIHRQPWNSLLCSVKLPPGASERPNVSPHRSSVNATQAHSSGLYRFSL